MATGILVGKGEYTVLPAGAAGIAAAFVIVIAVSAMRKFVRSAQCCAGAREPCPWPFEGTNAQQRGLMAPLHFGLLSLVNTAGLGCR